jgi:hypothetical protein
MGVDPISIALIASAAGGATTSFLGSKRTAREGEQAERRGQREIDKVTADRVEKEKQGVATENLRRERERQRALAFMNQGRAGTIKTSKVGVAGDAPYAQRTIGA